MRADVAAYCRRERLLSEGDAVLCAVSGGADSTAMLLCLLALSEEFGLTVRAAHFNHALRGDESNRDEAFVRSLCARLGVPLAVDRADVAAYAAAHRLSVETAARTLRYRFLASLPCDRLATAHTADDNAETVLQHLLRGSGLRGLGGIPPKSGKLIRPLLCVTHEQAEAYLLAAEQPWVEDSTNALPVCARNRLRAAVMPLLRAENPAFAAHVLQTATLAREEDAFLDVLAQRLLHSAETETPDEWLVAPLREADPVLRRRALRQMTARFLPQDVSRAHIAALEALLASPDPSARTSLPDGLTAARRYDRLRLGFPADRTFAPTPLSLDPAVPTVVAGRKIFCRIEENYKKSANTPFHFAVKYDMIGKSTPIVRPRRVGDTLTLPDGHHRSLKKLLIDRKLPRAERDCLPVIESDGTLLGVSDIGVNFSHVALAGSPALIIHIEKEEM